MKAYFRKEETIAAISTPLGKAGIGIVRMSGNSAIAIAEKIFRPKNPKSLSQLPSHTIHYGYIINGDEIVDEVLLTIMRAPYTYTKEDIVEINCHGGITAVREVLKLCLDHGARLAEPGEFTFRAYINGRIDLAQAEAVLNIVNAKTEKALKVASSQLYGTFSFYLRKIKDALLKIVAEVEALIDFPEEEIDVSLKDLYSEIKSQKNYLEKLLCSAKFGELLQDGLRTVICGKPNVGKSLLLNALIGKERAIVTPLPGTTRDVIAEIIDINGIPLRLLDTAGIVEPSDLIEKEGIKRTKEEIANADIILFVLDNSRKWDCEDDAILDLVKDKKFIFCINKIDLEQILDISKILDVVSAPIIKVSALKKTGIEDLKEAIYHYAIDTQEVLEIPIIINARHHELLKNCNNYLNSSLKDYQEKSLELVAEDLRLALKEINSILGDEEIEPELLQLIFSRFCIGK